MESFSLILVLWATMCLLVHSHDRPTNPLCTMSLRNKGLRVKPNGNIIWKKGTPTLFNLLREETFKFKSNNVTVLKFSLKAVATGNLICMNRTGYFYTVETKENSSPLTKDQRKQLRRTGRSAKRILPPEDCLFKSLGFNYTHTYENVVGIYSAAHSNTTIGRFISFTSNGTIRAYRKSFDEMDKNALARINLAPIRDLDEMISYLNNTVFGRDPNLNRSMSNCIKKEEPTFRHKKLRHDLSFKNNSLKNVIRKCKNRYKKKQRFKHGKQHVRRSIKQDFEKRRHA